MDRLRALQATNGSPRHGSASGGKMTTASTNDKQQASVAKRRAQRAVLSYAFLRSESALTIALTALLAFFLPSPLSWWRWWYWLGLGGIFEGLIVATSLTDDRTHRKIAAAMLRDRYNPATIKTRRYRDKIEQAMVYREQIENTIATTPVGLLREHLYSSTAGVADWIGRIFAIAERLDAYERDTLIHRDLQEVPVSIQTLRKSEADEDDPVVRQQIRATLDAKRSQWDNLKVLQNKIEEAEYKLEETVTSLGTVYSQFQLVRAQKVDRANTLQLSASIQEQVERLQDILDSMNRLYRQQH